jgi:hypothetical protein
MPPADFCSRVFPEHTHGLSRPRPPWQRRTAAGPSGATPCGILQPGCLRSGVFWAFRRLDPHHDDRSSQWIYPNLIGPGTPCRDSVPDTV